MRERWKDIPGFEGYYQVSNLGRVRSVDRTFIRVRNGSPEEVRRRGQIMALKTNEAGYLALTLHMAGKRHYVTVHRLVAKAFKPNPQGLPEVDHRDSDPSNAKASNLKWVTSLKNKQLMVQRGRSSRGSRNGRAQLTEIAVREMRRLHALGETVASLARGFGVSDVAAGMAIRGRTWSHV